MKAKLILIGGVSRSGKSTLAKELESLLPNSISLDQDDFILPESQIPKIKERTDWEDPNSIDWDPLVNKLNQLATQHDFLILEGIFAFNSHQINAWADYSIYLNLPYDSFFKRRKEETRWGIEPDWYLEHVWNAHQQYANPHQITYQKDSAYTDQLAREIAQTFL